MSAELLSAAIAAAKALQHITAASPHDEAFYGGVYRQLLDAIGKASHETGPCDKCQGDGKRWSHRCGEVDCEECDGLGWFLDGEAALKPKEVFQQKEA